jgi:DnaK suppressor protein
VETTHWDVAGAHDGGAAPTAGVVPDDEAHTVDGVPDQGGPDRILDDVQVGDRPAPDPSTADFSTVRRSVDDIERLLDEVEDALGRLDEGTYGVCSSCGSPITDERLATSPTAARCATCDPGGPEG